MITVSQMREFSSHMVMSFGIRGQMPIYLWPWAWNGFRKLGLTRICATGCHHLLPLHQSVGKLCLKKWNRESFLVFLYSPFRSPLWWPYSCWLRSAMMTSSMPQSTNVLFLWTSSVPYPGVCSCLLIRMIETDWIFQGNWPFRFFFFSTENVPGVIYLPGRWTLILSSICMTSCEREGSKGEMTHCDSKTKGGFLCILTHFRRSIWQKYVEKN